MKEEKRLELEFEFWRSSSFVKHKEVRFDTCGQLPSLALKQGIVGIFPVDKSRLPVFVHQLSCKRKGQNRLVLMQDSQESEVLFSTIILSVKSEHPIDDFCEDWKEKIKLDGGWQQDDDRLCFLKAVHNGRTFVYVHRTTNLSGCVDDYPGQLKKTVKTVRRLEKNLRKFLKQKMRKEKKGR